MLDFEGKMSELSRRSKHKFVFEDYDDNATDLAYHVASISTSDWKSNNNANVYASFSVPLSVEY